MLQHDICEAKFKIIFYSYLGILGIRAFYGSTFFHPIHLTPHILTPYLLTPLSLLVDGLNDRGMNKSVLNDWGINK